MEASDSRKQCFGDRNKAGRILEGTGGQHRAIDRGHEGIGLILWRRDQLYASLASAQRQNPGKPRLQRGEMRLDCLRDVLWQAWQFGRQHRGDAERGAVVGNAPLPISGISA